MTESKALLMIFAAVIILTTAASFVLAALHANGAVRALAVVLIIGVAADTSSRVGMHYGALKRRQQREASLLR
jgi:preprotein translocase subunit SecF